MKVRAIGRRHWVRPFVFSATIDGAFFTVTRWRMDRPSWLLLRGWWYARSQRGWERVGMDVRCLGTGSRLEIPLPDDALDITNADLRVRA